MRYLPTTASTSSALLALTLVRTAVALRVATGRLLLLQAAQLAEGRLRDTGSALNNTLRGSTYALKRLRELLDRLLYHRTLLGLGRPSSTSS